ncbi:three-Cys-motif partner protein TcmP [Streptomyces sp. WMMB303]|uniref:three-Cys-motif partner protein TcmP n=1 Tax=Streptomyces sp. WMMB303 TaxID=3034154 RepID=UPI0023ECB97C|nr:three-Cys-motif partner protein TcmP [Streptomyces sp. WMMB303]MDF4251848.1 three-Cys-motif partner protein TcmP [Streptomyces sp. WMMB303]MDF4254522.1 three-Cys-motif partner protein TcmP [Streptomyces sp. WMMB303]
MYEHGEPGSPVVAYDVFAGALHRYPKRLRMFLMEEHKQRAQQLDHQMGLAQARRPSDLRNRLSVDVREGDFHPALIQKLRATGSLGKPLFVLLDGYGGPDIPYSLLHELAQQPSTEVMVTFAPSFLTRFAEKDAAHRQRGDAAFGGQEWQEVFRKPKSDKFPFLRDRYKETLHRAGFSHTLQFEMLDEGGRLLYLIFGTSHAKGLEKMKDAMWGVDPSHGIRYRDPKDPGQQQLDLALEPNTAPLRRILLDHVASSNAGRTVEELQAYTLLETVFRPAQVINVIRRMRDAEAVRTEPNGVTKKTRVLLPASHPTPSTAEQAALW